MNTENSLKKSIELNQSEFQKISKDTTINWKKQIGNEIDGVVYEGLYSQNNAPQIPCAIKQTKGNQNYQQEKVRYERIKQIQEKFKVQHPQKECNLVRIFELISNCDETQSIVMELCESFQSIFQYQQEEMRFTPYNAIRFTKQLAKGLINLHSDNFIHKDLRPDNIFLIKKGDKQYLKISVYGLVKDETTAKSTYEAIFYLSPEIVSSKKKKKEGEQEKIKSGEVKKYINLEINNPKVDIWALGAILHELLTGKKLIIGSNDLKIFDNILYFGSYKSKWEKAQNPINLINSLTPEKQSTLHKEEKNFFEYYKDWNNIKNLSIINLLDKMLQNDPNKRYSAQDVYDKCKQILMEAEIINTSKEFFQSKIAKNVDNNEKLKLQQKQYWSSFDIFFISDSESTTSLSTKGSQNQLTEIEFIFSEIQKQINLFQEQLKTYQAEIMEKADATAKIKIQKDEEIQQSLSKIHSCYSFLFKYKHQFIKSYSYSGKDISDKNLFLSHFLSFFRLFQQQNNKNPILSQQTMAIKAILLPNQEVNFNDNENVLLNKKNIKSMDLFYISFQNEYQSLFEILLKFKNTNSVEFNKQPSIILQKINILLQISFILKEMHKNNIFHESLTTQKICFDQEQKVIIGFWSKQEGQIQKYIVMTEYLRFEAAFKSQCQLKGYTHQETSVQADLWSLGVIAHYMFSLKHLFEVNHKMKDIILSQRFNYLKLWRDCKKYNHERENNKTPINNTFEKMNQILREIPNEQIAELISGLLVSEGKQLNIDEVIERLEQSKENFNQLVSDLKEGEKQYSIFIK